MSPRALRIAVVLGVFAALAVITPPDLPVCGFRWLTGRPCPLCGLTHALAALAKGHFAEAIHLHALSPLAVVLLFAIAWRPDYNGTYLTGAAAFALYGALRMCVQ